VARDIDPQFEGLKATNYPARADGEFAAAREEVGRFVLPKNSAPPTLKRKTE
jgi:hypothetical protein